MLSKSAASVSSEDQDLRKKGLRHRSGWRQFQASKSEDQDLRKKGLRATITGTAPSQTLVKTKT